VKHIKYPKLILLLCSFVLAYTLYVLGYFDPLPGMLRGYGYVSMFLGGLLFSFGFTTPFAIVIFVAMANEVHPLLGAVVAGCGAVIADMTIFGLIRFSFLDELHRLKTSVMLRMVRAQIHRETMPERIRQYVLWSIAGIIIASPLPDEFGVTLLSGLSEIKEKQFAITCFIFNTVGILIILLTTQVVA
jgi:hypothetical protein